MKLLPDEGVTAFKKMSNDMFPIRTCKDVLILKNMNYINGVYTKLCAEKDIPEIFVDFKTLCISA